MLSFMLYSEDPLESIDPLVYAINNQNLLVARYHIHTYFESSLSFKHRTTDDTNRKEHQANAFNTACRYKPPYLIHLEYFIEEIKTKGTA